MGREGACAGWPGNHKLYRQSHRPGPGRTFRLSYCPSRKVPALPEFTVQILWSLGVSSSMQKPGKCESGGRVQSTGNVNELCTRRESPGPCWTHTTAFRVCMCVPVHACARARVHALGGGDAVTLTGGCLRFRPGRPTFRAVVLGSCRSSLPRASSGSSPSCGYRHSL